MLKYGKMNVGGNMTVELGIIVSLIGCILGVVGFVIGQKKSGKDDGLSLGTFMRRNKS